ncbi:major facilitator superfamily protein [Stylonychia lemnae]|uniref:Major facilitator superfamily protein n=1 Tax=Stylonychia lemnae TaxID=5949 RepID=A0A078AFJ3_STYLE|nr:major facilitator superfamily protein [Stylonychia lemnae]|eukprot:CDW80606.1 major facilitator superfamily protein [Stylonychia lemnae]
MVLTKYKNFKQLTILAFGVLLLQISYTSTANILSLILQKNGYGPLGNLSIACVYIAWGLGSLFSPTIYKRLGSRKSIFLGVSSNAIWIYSSIICLLDKDMSPNAEIPWYKSEVFGYIIVLGCSTFNGFFNCPMWVAFCKQISSLSSKETYGTYFSYFWCYYISAQIFGNSLASLVLEKFSEIAFFIIMGSIAMLASIYFCFLTYQDDAKHKNSQIKESLLKGSNKSSLNNTKEVQDNQEANAVEKEIGEEQQSVKQDVLDMFRMIASRKMRYMIPQIFYTGVSFAFYTGQFISFIYLTTPANYTEQQQFSQSMGVMSLLGFGALVGALGIGYTYDKHGHKNAAFQNIVILILVSIFLFGFIYKKSYDAIVFMMVFTWGVMDSSMATHSYTSLGIEFNDSPIAFAIYNTFQSLAVIIFSCINIAIKDWNDLAYYAGAIIILGVFCFGFNYNLPDAIGDRPKKNSPKQVTFAEDLEVINKIE